MSLFGELDVESAEDNPFAIPDGVYDAAVFEVKVGPTKNKDKVGMTLVYKITEGPQTGKTVQEWKHVPQPADAKNPTEEEARALSYLKARMISLGVPAEKINTIQSDDLLGREVVITLVTKGEYQNVRKVTEKQDTDSLAAKFS